MILSTTSATAWFAWAALVAYALAAWPRQKESRVDTLALAVGWLLHALALVFDIAGSGAGARFGFAPVLSLTVWMVILVYGIESRMLPLPAVSLTLVTTAL